VQRFRGFTLIEVVLAVFILVLLLGLAVPTLEGLFADKRLRHSLDEFNNLVHQAQERSVTERRPYLIVWNKNNVSLRPEVFAKGEEMKPTAAFTLGGEDTLKITLTAALMKKPAPEWIFWPSGACEPATVQFKGPAGSWTANYAALTARPELVNYAAR
jgi:prepilin-type N-terminal cleavage/methylation domain-containing protein